MRRLTMNNNTILISAYFADLHLSEFGGRTKHLCESKYLPSLKSIKKTETPLYIWYDDRYHDEYYIRLRALTSEQDILEGYSLYDSSLYMRLRKLKMKKDINSYRSQRSYDFCINKLWMIERSLHHMPDYEYYWWMDMGLSYENLFPHKYFPFIHQENHWERFSECTLFCPELIKKLNQEASNKVSIFMINRPEHGVNRQEFPHYYDMGKTVIGGLFGGRKDIMQHFISKFLIFVEECIDQEKLYVEEVYLSIFYMMNPHMFNVYEFDTWYSQDQTHALDEYGQPPPGQAFFHHFEKLLDLKITEYQPI